MSLAIDDGNFPLNTTIDRNNSNYKEQALPVRQAHTGVNMISSATQRETPARPMTQENVSGRRKYMMAGMRGKDGQRQVVTRPKNSATIFHAQPDWASNTEGEGSSFQTKINSSKGIYRAPTTTAT